MKEDKRSSTAMYFPIPSNASPHKKTSLLAHFLYIYLRKELGEVKRGPWYGLKGTLVFQLQQMI